MVVSKPVIISFSSKKKIVFVVCFKWDKDIKGIFSTSNRADKYIDRKTEAAVPERLRASYRKYYSILEVEINKEDKG